MSTGGALLQWLGLAGALLFVASASCRGAPPPAPANPAAPVIPDASRCTWRVPDPIPAHVIRRAVELLALGDPLGTEYLEPLDGTIYKFRRAMHPPSQNNLDWHPGIDALECAIPTRNAAAMPRNDRAAPAR